MSSVPAVSTSFCLLFVLLGYSIDIWCLDRKNSRYTCTVNHWQCSILKLSQAAPDFNSIVLSTLVPPWLIPLNLASTCTAGYSPACHADKIPFQAFKWKPLCYSHVGTWGYASAANNARQCARQATLHHFGSKRAASTQNWSIPITSALSNFCHFRGGAQLFNAIHPMVPPPINFNLSYLCQSESSNIFNVFQDHDGVRNFENLQSLIINF